MMLALTYLPHMPSALSSQTEVLFLPPPPRSFSLQITAPSLVFPDLTTPLDNVYLSTFHFLKGPHLPVVHPLFYLITIFFPDCRCRWSIAVKRHHVYGKIF